MESDELALIAKKLLAGQSCDNCFIHHCIHIACVCPLGAGQDWCKEWAPTNVFGSQQYTPRIQTLKDLGDVLQMLHATKFMRSLQ